MNYAPSTRNRIADLVVGMRVDRAAAAFAAALTPIFTISGGAVLMTGFFGKMTVAGGANTVHIEATPTTGASIPVAANLDVNAMIVGDYYTVTGVGTDAAKYNATTTGLCMMAYRGFILPIGTLDYHASATEGSMSWSIFYVPLEDGAYITAV
jgi:hypothetical protein